MLSILPHGGEKIEEKNIYIFITQPINKTGDGKKIKKKIYIYITQPLQICIGPTIHIGQESWCLPYAGFFLMN